MRRRLSFIVPASFQYVQSNVQKSSNGFGEREGMNCFIVFKCSNLTFCDAYVAPTSSFQSFHVCFQPLSGSNHPMKIQGRIEVVSHGVLKKDMFSLKPRGLCGQKNHGPLYPFNRQFRQAGQQLSLESIQCQFKEVGCRAGIYGTQSRS